MQWGVEMKKISLAVLMILLSANVFADNPKKTKSEKYKEELATQLKADSVRVVFTPDTVLSAVTNLFPVSLPTQQTLIPEMNEDMSDDEISEKAEQMLKLYDRVIDEKGAVSADDLFKLCVEMGITNVNICNDQFIKPMLEMDEYVNSKEFDSFFKEQYNGYAMNQACTPPESDFKDFGVYDVPNMVCTTGKYAQTDPAFEKAMITKFRLEGGCTDTQSDGCGRTCFGVCGKYHPEVKNPNFSRADAEKIAHDIYVSNKINLLPDAIRGDVFMALWGTGQPKKSIGYLQEILGVPQTNIVDFATINAARTYNGNLRKRFLARRWRALEKNKTFSGGWAKGILVYIANGCHTQPKTPLLRNSVTVKECGKYK